MQTINRRKFIKSAGIAMGSLSSLGMNVNKPRSSKDLVRIGIVGTGKRGRKLMKTLLDIEGVEVPALCDINEDNLALAQKLLIDKNRNKAAGYSRDEWDFKRLVERADLDAVINATPWKWHKEVVAAIMNAGKYAGAEVPLAKTVDGCWELVEIHEKTGAHCMFLENVCYFRNVMMILNMVRQGVLGDLLHCECGYQHDTRHLMFDESGKLLWRAQEAVERNENLYPTHPIGPTAWWFNINRGDRFTYLVSMSTKALGMQHFAEKRFGEHHPAAKIRYKLGDISTSLIQTHNGLTVTLYHNRSLPRPYDLIFRLQGTEGIYSGTLDKIYIEDKSPKPHTWEATDRYFEQYDHPMWKKWGSVAKKYGHGGADYMLLQQFVHAVKTQSPPPIDVYDGATWSVLAPLSGLSVANKSKAVDIPDFTRGKWMTNKPIPI
jgi:predicted dehydrogenase